MSKAAPVVLGHWYHLTEGLEASPQQYYSLIEEALKRREIPNSKTLRINWKEGGLMSAKREYLRVKRKEYVIDICGAPFGNGFFFSWWLGELPSGFLEMISGIPFIGPVVLWIFERLIKPATYYKIDTATMFQLSVHSAVLEVVDQLTEDKGLKALSESERKPIMKQFFTNT